MRTLNTIPAPVVRAAPGAVMRRGADPNGVSAFGVPLLQSAAQCGYAAVLRLLGAGAAPDSRNKYGNITPAASRRGSQQYCGVTAVAGRRRRAEQ